MLIATKTIYGNSVEGADGHVGTVKDLLFGGESWSIRYLDVDTGRWLPGRRVILSPTVVRTADYASRRFVVQLTRQQVEDSPSLESEVAVSRQKEIELARHYTWGAYWTIANTPQAEAESDYDPSLRSAREVAGYRVQAIDGEIGHVEDFILDDSAWDVGPWEIRYLVLDTGNWLPGRHVLIPPLWAESIDWESKKVEIGLTRELIEKSPEYDPNKPVNRQYEEVYYDYYGRPRYWTGTGHAV